MKLTRRKLFKFLGVGAGAAVILPLAKISLPPGIKAIASPKKTGNRVVTSTMLTSEEVAREAVKLMDEVLALNGREAPWPETGAFGPKEYIKCNSKFYLITQKVP